MYCVIQLPDLPARRGGMFYFRALTIGFGIDFVDGRDVGCCKIWTPWRQDAY